MQKHLFCAVHVYKNSPVESKRTFANKFKIKSRGMSVKKILICSEKELFSERLPILILLRYHSILHEKAQF